MKLQRATARGDVIVHDRSHSMLNFSILPLYPNRSARLAFAAGCALFCLSSCQKDNGEEKEDDPRESTGGKSDDDSTDGKNSDDSTDGKNSDDSTDSDDNTDEGSAPDTRVTTMCKSACEDPMKSCNGLPFTSSDDKCDDTCSDKMTELLDGLKNDSCQGAFEDLMLCSFKLKCWAAAEIFQAFSEEKYYVEEECKEEMSQVNKACGAPLSEITKEGATVHGKTWTKIHGLARPNSEGRLMVLMTNNENLSCDEFPQTVGEMVLFDVDAKEGEYEDITVTYAEGSNGVYDKKARVLISELTDDTMSGVIHSRVSDDNDIVSAFSISRCKES